ncbi:MAG: MBL fold metallo-hydrolase [Anaerolineae bacterium]|nr:MBL fold metallo-hydrolase [Anaerolineae bacterium]
MGDKFSVTFYGVRGSYPTPGPGTARIGGNTPCVHVRAGAHNLIFDAGTGIITLGKQLALEYKPETNPLNLTLFFTHSHHDHMQGFPFFVPSRFQLTTLYIFGPRSLDEDLARVLALSMLPPLFPITVEELPCERVVRNLSENEVIMFNGAASEPRVMWSQRDADVLARAENQGALCVQVLRSAAHPQGVFIYRVNFQGRAFVFATDVESYIGNYQRLVKFAEGADLMAHDAQYTDALYLNGPVPRQGWGHSTWRMAVETANASNVKQLALYHHEPEHDDDALEEIEKRAQQVRANTFLAREGMTINL